MKKQTLKKFLVSRFVYAAVIPILLIGIISYYYLNVQTTKTLLFKNERLVQYFSSELDLFIKIPKTLLRQISLLASSHEHEMNEIIHFLDEAVQKGNFFESVYILNSSMRVIAVGLPERLVASRSNYIALDMSANPAVTKAFETRTPQWSDISVSPITGNSSLTYTVSIGSMIFVGSFNLSKIYDEISVQQSIHGISSFIVDGNGTMIFHENKEYVDQQLNVSNLPPVTKALNGETGTFDYRFDNTDYIGSTAILTELGWTVIVSQKKETAYAPVQQIAYFFIFGFLLSIVIVAYWSNALSRIILKPINVLHDSFKVTAAGDYSSPIPEQKYHEIEHLAGEFREMVKAINERENKLSINEKRYREIFNSPNESIFIHDAHTAQILDVNQAAIDTFGYTSSEMLKLTIGDISVNKPPFVHAEAAKKVKSAMLSSESQTFEWLCKKRDSTLFWTEVSLKYRMLMGKPCVIAVVRNIEERKRAIKELAKEKELLSVTLRSIADGVITTDTEGNIVLMNSVAETLTGWELKEAKGKSIETVFVLVCEKTGDICDNPVQNILKSGKKSSIQAGIILVSKHDEQFFIADSGAPIFDGDMNIIGSVIVFRDVSTQKQLESEMMKARKLESVGVLAGGIAHDFNNILAAILGNINLAGLYSESPKKIKVLMGEAETACLRAKDLTQQLLTFSKGGEPVKKISSITNVIQDSAGFTLRGSNILCKYSFPEDLWPAEIDPGQISQVVQNLVINARQAMTEGGEITISGNNSILETDNNFNLSAGNYISISITDQGGGINQDDLGRIFDLYYTTKNSGSGLGLAVALSIISKHDGYITASTVENKGTTFTFMLPASPGQELSPRTPLEKVETQSASGNILVMDDEKMIRDVLRTMLESMGYSVVTANNGDDAIKRYQSKMQTQTPFDCVIVDLTVPGGKGGQETVQEILQINPEAKVVAASGYSNDPVMANSTEYGFCMAITKPFQLEELKQTLQACLSS